MMTKPKAKSRSKTKKSKAVAEPVSRKTRLQPTIEAAACLALLIDNYARLHPSSEVYKLTLVWEWYPTVIKACVEVLTIPAPVRVDLNDARWKEMLNDLAISIVEELKTGGHSVPVIDLVKRALAVYERYA